MGCFAMTEIGHGSNVQGLETYAVYQRESDSFILHSPTYSAGKNYIGNAAEDGQLAVVFAQLEMNGQKHGVHAFLVPIRGENGNLLPGVRIEDNGLKMGLNGVDNGRIWFDHVKVPRIEMLNRFADVTADGQYRSDIQSQSARFFTMIGTLVSGRISIAATANSATKSALTIAVRYAARRRQFGSPKSDQGNSASGLPSSSTEALPAYRKSFRTRLCPQISDRTERDSSLGQFTFAGNSGCRFESRYHLECHSDHPDLPRSLRRRRLPRCESN